MGDVVTVEEVVGAAGAETGLDDLGDPACAEGLAVLLDCVAREAALNDIGRMILRAWVHERLVNRLRVVDWVQSHPEVRSERVERPIVVVGMLRTGSTLLCELLATDPENRPLMKWEGMNALPPPETATFTTDPRIAAEVEKQEGIYSMVPALKAVHWEPGDGPTECVALLTQSFRAQDWHGLFKIPSWVEWFHACDMQPAYDYHRLSLQLLQSARARPVDAQGTGAPPRARRAARHVPGRAHRRAAPRPDEDRAVQREPVGDVTSGLAVDRGLRRLLRRPLGRRARHDGRPADRLPRPPR